MMPEKAALNWQQIRNEYESTAATLQELALKYGVSDGTMRSRKCREKWEKCEKRDTGEPKDKASNATRVTQRAKATPASNTATKKTLQQSSQRCNENRKSGTESATQPHDKADKAVDGPSLKYCGARAKNGKGTFCMRPAGWGTHHPGTGRCKLHGGCSPGAPKGNKYGVKTGEFERIFGDVVDADEKALARDLDLDKLAQVNHELQIITIREHRMMMRIQRLKDINGDESGMTTTMIETTTGGDDSEADAHTETGPDGRPVAEGYQIINVTPGVEVQVPKQPGQGEVKVKEKKEGILGQILAIEEALTRVQEKKMRLLELKHKIELTRGPEPADVNNYVDALKGTAAEVWGEENAE